MPQHLLVKIAVDDIAAERLSVGLSVAAAAAATGVPLSVWLAGEASRLGTNAYEADPDTAALLSAVEAGAMLHVCARCAQRRGITEEDLRPGAVIAGAAAFVAEVMQPDARVLVY